MNGGQHHPLTGPDPERLPNGAPRPVDPATGKPLMSRREANWHAHVSGMAEREAAEAGGDPAAIAALCHGAAQADGGPFIAGLTLRPLTIGTLEALHLAGSVYAAENPAGRPMIVTLRELTRTVLCFARPEWVYERLSAGAATEVDAEAVRIGFSMTKGVMEEANAWIEAQMREFFGLGDAEKKPSPAVPPLPPAPPPAPPWPETGAATSVVGSLP